MSPRTSDVSVSNPIHNSHLIFIFLVDKPQMVPRKDYDDYTTFINDTFNDKKVAMLKTFSEKSVDRKESRTQSNNPYMSNANETWLKKMIQMRNSSMLSGSKNMHLRNMSHRITTPQ